MRHGCVDVIELEPAVNEMARRCSVLNQNVLNEPKVRHIQNDGREFVSTTRDKYDLLMSEPSNPFRAGLATLYTVEFYKSAIDRLNDDGLFLQWMQSYEIDEMGVEIVLGTMRSVFPHVEIWQTMTGDILLVCSRNPPSYTAAQLRERISHGALRDALHAAWHVNDLEGFLAHFTAGPGFVDEIEQQSTLRRNTDDQTILEYGFAKTVGRPVRFSLELLHRAAVDRGVHRPFQDDSVDWETVEIRRLEDNLLHGGEFSTGNFFSQDHQALVAALYKYRKNDYVGAVKVWPMNRRTGMGEIERLALAHCYAELGRTECLELLEPVAEQCPVEAAAVRTIYYQRVHKTDEMLTAAAQLCQAFRETPWNTFDIVSNAFDCAIEQATDDKEAGKRVFKMLDQPFLVYRYEQTRLVARLKIAQGLGPKYVVEALAPMEPNIPWMEDVLAFRAEAYAAEQHPLAKRAEKDLKWYRDHKPSDNSANDAPVKQ